MALCGQSRNPVGGISEMSAIYNHKFTMSVMRSTKGCAPSAAPTFWASFCLQPLACGDRHLCRGVCHGTMAFKARGAHDAGAYNGVGSRKKLILII